MFHVFSYTDHVRIPLNSAMELFEAADLFMIPRLKTICEKRMLQSISVTNAPSIFYGALRSFFVSASKPCIDVLSSLQMLSPLTK
jgi:hypothetical protein